MPTQKTGKATVVTARNTTLKRQRVIQSKRGVVVKWPESTVLSQFPITDKQIADFERVVKSQRDCVINALQLLGALDANSANIMRIMIDRSGGIDTDEIENIFVLLKGNRFQFKSTGNYQEFVDWVEKHLLPGHGVFAGYTEHVFILARRLDGVIILIDPQSTGTMCEINQCQDLIRGHRQYYLLFHSPEKLTKEQLRTLGFIV